MITRTNSKTWKAGVMLNISIALLILAINIAVPAWAASRYGLSEGILFNGSCHKTETVSLVSHAIINILGTLLLSASNYTMQILCAPTRLEIDDAHEKGRWLCIGAQSFRNIKAIGLYRRSLWLLLALSSIPLHLLYNSVLYSTSGDISSIVAVGTPKFLQGADIDLSFDSYAKNYSTPPLPSIEYDYISWAFPLQIDEFRLIYDVLAYFETLEAPKSIGANSTKALEILHTKYARSALEELSIERCKQECFQKKRDEYRNILIMSDDAPPNSSILWVDEFPAHTNLSDRSCDIFPDGAPRSWNWATKDNCAWNFSREVLDIKSDWSVGLYHTLNAVDFTNGSHTKHIRIGSHRVSKCFAEPFRSPCAVKYDPRLLATVVSATLVKIGVMIATLLQYKRPSLVTVGDGLASFLERPDQFTKGCCLATVDDFSTDEWIFGAKSYHESKERRPYSTGVSPLLWRTTVCTFSVSMFCVMGMFVSVYRPTSFEWSFSSLLQPTSVTSSRGLDITTLIILANIPQLFLSLNYIFLNRLISCMAASREWSRLAYYKKGLRTSNPQGSQRSTYWLQLPLKFSLPLMASSAILHYLASQALFFGSIQHYGSYNEGKDAIDEDYTGLGYSHDATYLLMAILLLTYTAIFLFGRLHNQPGPPSSHFCSAVISAACHPAPVEDHVHLKAVQWGEIVEDGEPTTVGHCSFSNLIVTQPVEGKEYM